MYDMIVAQNATARIIVLPFGQGSPVHTSSAEHIHFQMRSEIEFTVGDDEKFVVEPEDLFFIPASVSYSYANIGETDAVFLSVHSRADEWPPTVEYAD